MDDLDRRLIAVLRTDGRAPVAKIATILGVSRATVQARLDRLLESGDILGFTVRVRRAEESSSIRAVMMVEVAGKTTVAVIKALRGMPELRALHTTNGAWDLVVEIQVESLVDFDRVLREVRAIDGVANTETSLLLTSVL